MAILTKAPRMGRKIRSPQHTWNLATVPFALTPFLMAPVLPGETLKNGVFQSRVVTEPINNSLIGWWKEYYFFYVRLSQLPNWSIYERMLIDEGEAPVGGVAASSLFYASGNTLTNPYAKEAYELIHDWYFAPSDDGSMAPLTALSVGTGSLRPVRVAGNNAFDSVHDTLRHAENDVDLVVGPDDKFTASELEQLQLKYELAKSGGLTSLTYDDWLREQGIGVDAANVNAGKPELLRFVREWTYPANTVDAATGKVMSVCSWAVAGRIDKDRFFSEPGFIVGVTVSRPKVYLSNQKGHVCEFMTNMRHWLGGIIGEVNDATYAKIAKGASSLIAGTNNDYWLDFRDLFMYGDQWLGHDAKGGIALPAAGLNGNYPNDAMVASLFPDQSTKMVREDGVISLRIASRVRDPHPTTQRGMT